MRLNAVVRGCVCRCAIGLGFEHWDFGHLARFLGQARKYITQLLRIWHVAIAIGMHSQ